MFLMQRYSKSFTLEHALVQNVQVQNNQANVSASKSVSTCQLNASPQNDNMLLVPVEGDLTGSEG